MKLSLIRLGALCLGATSLALHAAPIKVDSRDLVATAVDANARVALAGYRAPWVASGNDRGAVADDLSLTHLTLTLNRTPERQAAFDKFTAEQQDPASPNYHQWLTPAQVGDLYGASQHDIDAASQWLTSQGLSVESVSPGRTRIVFSGAAAAVSRAFATPLHWYEVNGAQRLANTENPQIPAALAGAVQSVMGLQTAQFRHQHQLAAAPQALSARPQITFSGGSYGLAPGDVAKIYDIPSGYTGAGQTIAIVGQQRVYTQDIYDFQNMFGLAQKAPITIVPPLGADPGSPATSCTSTDSNGNCTTTSSALSDQFEATLDVQRATSTAPGATINLIASGASTTGANSGEQGVQIAIEYVIDTGPSVGNILSVSFAACESDNGSAVTKYMDSLFQQGASEGIGIFVASGDTGATCNDVSSTPVTTPLNINALCASSYVTCVGGTEFNANTNTSQYWSSSNNANGTSALGYIPEGAWNDPLNGTTPQYSATGGGVSQFIAKPSWQTGTGVPGTAGRYVPDISFPASTNNGYASCMRAQQGSGYTCAQGGYMLVAGGTSAGTPTMAGIAALLNQKTGSAQGNINPGLYKLAASSYASVFHDVTVASSAISNCTLATPSLCNNSVPSATALTGGTQGYAVGAGFDLATGWGSLDVGNLLSAWSGGGSSGGSTGGTAINANALTGLWYDRNYSGSGFNFVMSTSSSAGLLVTYYGWNAQGTRLWLTASSGLTSFTTGVPVTISLLQNPSGTFLAPSARTTPWGTLTLNFSSCTTATATLSGADGTVTQNLSQLAGAAGIPGC